MFKRQLASETNRVNQILFVKRASFLLCAFVFVACATTKSNQDSNRFILEGNAAALKGEFASAANSYESALKVSPENPSARRNLGIVLVKMGDYKRALKVLSSVQNEYSEDVEVLYFLGEASRGSNDFKNALQFYLKAANVSPQDLRVQKAMSWSYYRLGNLDKSLNLVKRLNRSNPDDLQVKLIYASVLNKLKKYIDVQTLLARVERAKFNVQSKDKISADTERTLLMSALAEAYVGSENCPKAEPLLNDILKSRPFLSSALIGAAKCDLKGNQKNRATARLERATKANPDAEEAYFLLGKLYETTDKTKATYYYKRFLLLAKDNPQYISESRITRSNLVNLEKSSSQ